MQQPDRNSPGMRFRRVGGSYQLNISSEADLRSLLELDEAQWALTSIDINAYRTDRRFLEFIDDDDNEMIRTDEVRRAIAWILERLRKFDRLEAGSDRLELDAIADGAANLRAAAQLILDNLGTPDCPEISIDQITNEREIIGCALRNGDGVLPPESIEDPELAALARNAMTVAAPVRDLSGLDGIDRDGLEKYRTLSAECLAWLRETEEAPEKYLPFGGETAACADAVARLREEIDRYFLASETLRFCGVRPQLCREEATANPFSPESIGSFLENAPAAIPDAACRLDFKAPLNPRLSDALRDFAALKPVAAKLVEGTLTLDGWNELKAQVAPYLDWNARKPAAAFDAIPRETLEAEQNGDRFERLFQLMEEDLAVANQLQCCNDLLKLALFQRYLIQFLNNYANLRELFNPAGPSMLQWGKLVMDGRHFTLTMPVKNQAEHKNIATQSDICVAYVEVSTGQPDKLRKQLLAVAITSGNMRNLFIGKRGVFFGADGDIWDAKVVDFIQQPVSISEALRQPFYRFGEFLGKQADKLLSARSNEAQKALEQSLAAAPLPGVVPNTAPKPAAAPLSGSMLLMSGGIGIAAIGSSVAFIVKSLQNISIWNILAVLLGIILIFGGPVVIISLVKLYRRSMARLLEANGCAVNRPMRLSRPMGAIFTFRPKLPRSFLIKSDIIDLFHPPKRHTLRNWILILIAAALLGGAGYWGYRVWFHKRPSETKIEKPEPAAPHSTAPATAAPAGAPTVSA